MASVRVQCILTRGDSTRCAMTAWHDSMARRLEKANFYNHVHAYARRFKMANRFFGDVFIRAAERRFKLLFYVAKPHRPSHHHWRTCRATTMHTKGNGRKRCKHRPRRQRLGLLYKCAHMPAMVYHTTRFGRCAHASTCTARCRGNGCMQRRYNFNRQTCWMRLTGLGKGGSGVAQLHVCIASMVPKNPAANMLTAGAFLSTLPSACSARVARVAPMKAKATAMTHSARVASTAGQGFGLFTSAVQ